VTLDDRIPSAIYSTDLRLLFIVTAVYTSLVGLFRQAANQEADEDVNSGMNFKVNSEFLNHSISGGVSDRIFWNCRDDSRTKYYYEMLYWGLFFSYFLAIVIYFVARVFITGFVANAAWKLTYDRNGNKVRHLEMMANGFKMITQLRRKLHFIKKTERTCKEFETKSEKLISDWNERWSKVVRQCESKRFLYNWLTILYIIPRYETLIMLTIVTFALTSYDIHPLGCLSHIDVFYNETEMSVTLKISQNVINYQKVSAILIVFLFFHWLAVKFIQYLLLPRRWGLLITDFFSMNLPCCNCLQKKCGCACDEKKCCAATCSFPSSLPCVKDNKSHYDGLNGDEVICICWPCKRCVKNSRHIPKSTKDSSVAVSHTCVNELTDGDRVGLVEANTVTVIN